MYFGRGINKIQNPYTLRDIYEFYCTEHSSNRLYDVPWSVYVQIANEFYKEIVNGIIEKNRTFRMPFRLGEFFILKEKIDLNKLNSRAIDWEKTNRYGKIIYHLNEHTDGYKYSYQWDKKDTKLPNLYFYRLVPTRTNKRRLARLIKSGDYDYFER